MSTLRCPRCGLGQAKSAGEAVEHCPRCLARTAGALSIRLEPRKRQPPPTLQPREAILRLARRVRAVQAR
jgi:tRNA(Ile2) C34 agmatinyltransferase TiaS